jgi:nucleolar protein 6
MEEDLSKLSKKQRKALEFKQKKSKEEREEEKAKKIADKLDKDQAAQQAKRLAEQPDGENDQPKKKRKTRRGKKGKGVNQGKGPRFILFVGNLPYDIKLPELVSHFKNCNPDRFRIRQEKGIAFLEFDNDTKEIQTKMETALRMHHSEIRGRKINVELTVGGGGNSETRRIKLKEKNEKLDVERNEKVKQTIKTRSEKKAEPGAAAAPGIHPSRAALIK